MARTYKGKPDGFVRYLNGAGGVALSIRGLAPLYSGFMSPDELRVAGALDAPDAELPVLRALFAGPAPHTTDGF